MATSVSSVQQKITKDELQNQWNDYLNGAIVDHNMDQLEDAVKNGAELNVSPLLKIEDQDGNEISTIGSSPLMECVDSNNTKAFDRLLELGASITLVNDDGVHLFAYAVVSGKPYFVQKLIAKAIEKSIKVKDYINAAYHTSSAVHWAVQKISSIHLIKQGTWHKDAKQNGEIQQQWLRWFNKEPNAVIPKERYVKCDGHVEPGGLIDLLLKNGANAEKADAWGVTPVEFLRDPHKHNGCFVSDKPSDQKYAKKESHLEYIGPQLDGAYRLKLVLCDRTAWGVVPDIIVDYYCQKPLQVIKDHIAAKKKKQDEKTGKENDVVSKELENVKAIALANKAKIDSAEALRKHKASLTSAMEQKFIAEKSYEDRKKKLSANQNLFFELTSKNLNATIQAYITGSTGLIARPTTTTADYLALGFKSLSDVIPPPFSSLGKLFGSLIQAVSDKKVLSLYQDIVMRLPLPEKIPFFSSPIALALAEYFNTLTMVDKTQTETLSKVALGIMLVKLCDINNLSSKETLEDQLINAVKTSKHFQEKLHQVIGKNQSAVDSKTLKDNEQRIKAVQSSVKQKTVFDSVCLGLQKFRKDFCEGVTNPKANRENIVSALEKQLAAYIPKGYTIKLTYIPFLADDVAAVKAQLFTNAFAQSIALQVTELVTKCYSTHLEKLSADELQKLSDKLTGIAAGTIFMTLCNSTTIDNSNEIMQGISNNSLLKPVFEELEANLKRHSPPSTPDKSAISAPINSKVNSLSTLDISKAPAAVSSPKAGNSAKLDTKSSTENVKSNGASKMLPPPPPPRPLILSQSKTEQPKPGGGTSNGSGQPKTGTSIAVIVSGVSPKASAVATKTSAMTMTAVVMTTTPNAGSKVQARK